MKKKAPDSWCPLPWNHISIKGNGSFRICCHSHSSETRGVIDNDNIFYAKDAEWTKVRNSEKLKSVRLKMLKGEWHDDCVRCKREFESGMFSRNLYERYEFPDLTYEKCLLKTREDGSIDEEDFPVQYLDVRFGNLCNLRCVMCSSTDSNQWYDDYVKIFKSRYFTDTGIKVKLEYDSKKDRWFEPNGIYEWFNDAYFWKELEDRSQKMKKIYIAGGEPFLIDIHYDFLKYCIENGFSKNINLEYNTNLTNIPTKAFELWVKFNRVSVGVSVDGLREVNDYIRYPSNFSQIERNLRKLDQFSDNFFIWITKSISVFNVYFIPEFIEWLYSSNFKFTENSKKNYGISTHPVTRPYYYNINILSENFKIKIKEKFKSFKEKWKNMKDKRYDYANKILDIYEKYMYKINFNEKDLYNHRKKFVEISDLLDQTRKTEWRRIFPLLKEEFENEQY
ncbi:MAG: twitch domain-containing radical SAM protein [Candidatus Dojkabacteria bacterium]|nr:twitch domain-containing radical SAM protein [Candidatus Dojkabacteria bacterium]